jgi:ATP-dependent helicase/nuclease subunit A
MPGPAPELKFHHVRAGAGAGKTRGLVEKVVEIFRQRQKLQLPTRLVVTTFTRKATQELKERLTEHACREQDPALLQFVTDPTRLHISTIHGLLNIFLRQFGHLAGMDAGFQLIGAGESNTLARLALREAVLATPDGLGWLETYGFDRMLAMCRRFETAYREEGGLAAAGLEDIEKSARAETDRWRKELQELASAILEEVDEPKWSEYGRALRDFSETWSGDGARLDALPAKPRRSKTLAHLESWFARNEELIDAFKDEMKKPCWTQAHWPAMAEEWRRFESVALEFSRRFNHAKESAARYELADLELKTMEIIRQKPFLGSLFGAEWDFWMIDEYQDTSPLQVACLNALSGDKPVYYVGDPQQSIYLFRGAEVRVFDEAEELVRSKNGELVVLKRNYRSQPDLLHWINDFMSTVSADFSRMDPREEAGPPSRSCVRLLKAEDEAQELNAVVNRVHSLIREGASLEKICILGRTHRTLIEVSRALRERGFPTHVHSSQGFSRRREVIDAQALWKFLINPHDNLNLAILLRSPWFYVPDAQLKDWMGDRPASLWGKIIASKELPESADRLRRILENQKDCGLARAFEEGLCDAAYLDLSLVNDPAGRKESNLWKLILKARALEQEGGQSILDFIGEDTSSDLLDVTEGDATSAQEPKSINLMTVHGSKGLQFEHVIIPQIGKKPQPARTSVLDHAGQKFFFPIFLGGEEEGGEKPAFAASPLDNAKVRDRSEREQREFNRLLYVAVTRAQSTLTLSWSETARDSWAARSPLFSQEPGVYEKPCYIYEVVKADQPAVDYVSPSAARGETRPRWVAAGVRHEEHKAVTDLIGGKPYVGQGQGDYMKRWQAQTLGTRVHRALEALKYGHMPAAGSEEAVDYVLGLKDPPMETLIREGEAEWGFQVGTAKQTVEGQIDLWGKADGRIYVVDYKSGSPRGQAKAFEQLGLYAWALRKFGYKEPIVMTVIYPLTRKTESRDFTEELFRGWELKFGGAQA